MFTISRHWRERYWSLCQNFAAGFSERYSKNPTKSCQQIFYRNFGSFETFRVLSIFWTSGEVCRQGCQNCILPSREKKLEKKTIFLKKVQFHNPFRFLTETPLNFWLECGSRTNKTASHEIQEPIENKIVKIFFEFFLDLEWNFLDFWMNFSWGFSKLRSTCPVKCHQE